MFRLWTSIDVRLRVAAVAVAAAVLLPLAWYLGSPLFIDVAVDERFPEAVPLVAPTGVPAAAMPTGAPAAAAMPTTVPTAPAPTAVPAAPVALSRGQFTEVDAIHKGAGTATVYQLPDSRRILRFEPFKVQNGPDLYVYLAGHPMPRSGAQLHDQGAFEVARLKGNVGDQNYELPADLDLSQYHAVVVYCKRFSVVFSTAELIAPQ